MSETIHKAPNKDQIKKSHHVLVSGGTGSGKTILAKKYLAGFEQVWMLDSKGDAIVDIENGVNPWKEVDPKKLTVVTKLEHIERASTPFIIYSPEYEELTPFHYNEFFKMAYFRKDVTVWVDECMAVSENAQMIPEYYKAILTRGRSRNTAVWSLTQRPSGIHPIILSQSTHFFVFNNNLLVDRKKLVDMTGASNLLIKPEGHNFWYWRDGWEEAVKAKIILKGGE